VKDYRPAWLDDVLARGAWFWQGEHAARDEVRVAFWLRDSLAAPIGAAEAVELEPAEQQVLALLDRLGASFATDVARASALEPTRVRRALVELMARGLVTNDRFDPLRPGFQSTLKALSEAAAARRDGRRLGIRPRRSISGQPEGRWSRLVRPGVDSESWVLAWAAVLLQRYGIVAREVAALDPAGPSWADLAPLLARAEWRGELRRGYFVEGLSGVQYATEDAAAELSRLSLVESPSPPPMVLLSTVDPANVYGAGAPFDIELLDGGTARLPRAPGNFLVIQAGRPILIIEAFGKRLTGLPWAAQSDLEAALKFLPSLTGPSRRIFKVEMYNGSPAVDSPVAARLAELGFVRDYPGMTYYAGWATTLVESP
jgi:ATP-dependent Lhr-like helicase